MAAFLAWIVSWVVKILLFLLLAWGAVILIMFMIKGIGSTVGGPIGDAMKGFGGAVSGIKLPAISSKPTVDGSIDDALRARQNEERSRQEAAKARAEAVGAITTDNLKMAGLLGNPRFGDKLRIAVYSYTVGLATTVAAKVAISLNGGPEDMIDITAGSLYEGPAVLNGRYEITAEGPGGKVQRTSFVFTGGAKDVEFKF